MIKDITNAVDAVTEEDIERISQKLQVLEDEESHFDGAVVITLPDEKIRYYVAAELAQERRKKRKVDMLLNGVKKFHGKIGDFIEQIESDPSLETASAFFEENSCIACECLEDLGEVDLEADEKDCLIIDACKSEISEFVDSNEEVLQKIKEIDGGGNFTVAIISGWRALVKISESHDLGNIFFYIA